MCPESFVVSDLTLDPSFNHVPSGDTLRRDAISSLYIVMVQPEDPISGFYI